MSHKLATKMKNLY